MKYDKILKKIKKIKQNKIKMILKKFKKNNQLMNVLVVKLIQNKINNY